MRSRIDHIRIVVWAALLAALIPAASANAQSESAVFPGERRIVVRPPRYRRGNAGFIVTEPNVEVFGEATGGNLPTPTVTGHSTSSHPGTADSMFQEVVGGLPEGSVYVPHGQCENGDCDDCDDCSPWHQLFAFKLFKTSTDTGIGHERVMLAPFELDNTQPLNNVSVRWDTFNRMITPDRAEYFWARPGVGPPLPERSIDYQELRFLFETGGKMFSVLTEVPIRSIDPVVNNNTTGLSNMSIGPKAVLVNGKRWQVSHIFRTFLKTGSPAKGWAVDHISLEPAVLVRYEWTKRTFLHGELKFRFPVGGDPDFAGQVLKYGFGVSTILYETDTFAAIPTLEFVGWSILDGQKSLPDGSIAGVDGENFGAVFPGIRFVLGPANDLGLFELGIGGGLSFSDNGLFENALRVDLRFSY